MSIVIDTSRCHKAWTPVVVKHTIWQRAYQFRRNPAIIRSLSRLINTLGNTPCLGDTAASPVWGIGGETLSNAVAAISYYVAGGVFFAFHMTIGLWALFISNDDDLPPSGGANGLIDIHVIDEDDGVIYNVSLQLYTQKSDDKAFVIICEQKLIPSIHMLFNINVWSRDLLAPTTAVAFGSLSDVGTGLPSPTSALAIFSGASSAAHDESLSDQHEPFDLHVWLRDLFGSLSDVGTGLPSPTSALATFSGASSAAHDESLSDQHEPFDLHVWLRDLLAPTTAATFGSLSDGSILRFGIGASAIGSILVALAQSNGDGGLVSPCENMLPM